MMEMEMDTEVLEIYVWPDNSWLPVEDYEDVKDAWRGDDFYAIGVPTCVIERGEWEVDTFLKDFVAATWVTNNDEPGHMRG